MKTLRNTDFMRTLSGMAAALLKETVDSAHPRIGHFTRPFSHQEEYLVDCLILAGQVNIACDQLHYALAYLSGYRSRKTSGGELISRADYIAYQIENLYFRLGMIPDRSLRLTNEVFRLGLPTRECRTRTITDNQHLRGTTVRARLRAIDEIVKPHREARNIIAHFGRYDDREFNKIESFFILQESEVQPDKWFINAKHIFKWRTDVFVKEKRTEFESVVSNLVHEVARLFEALLPPFRREHAALK
jgi:hypothetical protein